MSLESWRQKYYSITAEAFQEMMQGQVLSKDVVALRTAEHSLLKWTGLKPDNLSRHGVVKQAFTLVPASPQPHHLADFIDITADSCSLCRVFRYDVIQMTSHWCGLCPLYKLQRRTCDTEYSAWRCTDNPQRMIDFLQALVQKLTVRVAKAEAARIARQAKKTSKAGRKTKRKAKK